jgi:hypothetical protein
LKSSDGTERGIMNLGSPIGDGGYSKIQVINAFANYFKHRDEWPPTTPLPPTAPSHADHDARPWAKAAKANDRASGR